MHGITHMECVHSDNLLYTAISRASKLCILIGDKGEIPKIINRNQSIKRFTNLQGFLKERV